MFSGKETTVQVGHCLFDADAQLLWNRSGKPIHLRNQSFEVLRLLVDKRGSLVRRDDIFDKVWEDRFVTSDSLTQCIAEIRRAIGDDDHNLLVTVHRCGYRLVAVDNAGQATAPFKRTDPYNVVQMRPWVC